MAYKTNPEEVGSDVSATKNISVYNQSLSTFVLYRRVILSEVVALNN